MKLFKKDGGPESTVWGLFLIEIKWLFSIVLLRFENGSREAYHQHAFDCFSWVLSGLLVERHMFGGFSTYLPSWRPIVTRRATFHQVTSHGRTWVLSFRGPWSKTWLEYLPESDELVTLTHGRRVLARTAAVMAAAALCFMSSCAFEPATEADVREVDVESEAITLACSHFRAAKSAIIARVGFSPSDCRTYGPSTTTYCGDGDPVIVTFPQPVAADRTWARVEYLGWGIGGLVCKCSGGPYAPPRCTQLMSWDPSGWPNPLTFN